MKDFTAVVLRTTRHHIRLQAEDQQQAKTQALDLAREIDIKRDGSPAPDYEILAMLELPPL